MFRAGARKGEEPRYVQAIREKDAELASTHALLEERTAEIERLYREIRVRDEQLERWRRLRAFFGDLELLRPDKVLRLQRQWEQPPVFVASLPKSGTYLVAELLVAAGLRNCDLHLGMDTATDYRALEGEDRLRLAQARALQLPLEVSSSLVGDSTFAVGHIVHERRSVEALRPFRKLLCVREWRACLVSFMRFEERRIRLDSARFDGAKRTWIEEPAHRKMRSYLDAFGEEHTSVALHMHGWLRESEVLAVRFEDLLSGPEAERVNRVRRICAHVGVETTQRGARSHLLTALDSPSMTKSSSRSRLEEHWTDDSEEWFVKHGGEEVNRRFGYALNANRNLSSGWD